MTPGLYACGCRSAVYGYSLCERWVHAYFTHSHAAYSYSLAYVLRTTYPAATSTKILAKSTMMNMLSSPYATELRTRRQHSPSSWLRPVGSKVCKGLRGLQGETLCTLSVTLCTPYVHPLHTLCAPTAHPLYTLHRPPVHPLWTFVMNRDRAAAQLLSPTATQPFKPTAPQPNSPSSPQPHSPTAPQPLKPTALQPHSPSRGCDRVCRRL